MLARRFLPGNHLQNADVRNLFPVIKRRQTDAEYSAFSFSDVGQPGDTSGAGHRKKGRQFS